MDKPRFTIQQKHAELMREIGMRVRVYPGAIRRGSLTQADADNRIAILKEIAADYRQKDMFGEVTR